MKIASRSSGRIIAMHYTLSPFKQEMDYQYLVINFYCKQGMDYQYSYSELIASKGRIVNTQSKNG